MTLITASGSEVLTRTELLNLSSSVNGLSGLMLRDLLFAAMMRSLVEYSRTCDSSHSIFFHEACTTDVTKDLESCGVMQDGTESGSCRYVLVRKLVRRLLAALLFVKRRNEE